MKRRVSLWQFVPAILFAFVALACALSAQPTPVPTNTPTVTSTATVTPTNTPTVVPTPVVLISPQAAFNFFAAQVLGQHQDAQLSPYMGIMIWFEREGQQYGAMFGVDIQTGQWVWIDTVAAGREQGIDSQTHAH